MIIVSIVSLIISLFLQGLMSNFLGYTLNSLSIFSTMYVICNLVVLIPYYENKKKLFILTIVFGMLSDIVYSNTFIFCAFILIAIIFINKAFNFFFPTNLLTVNVISTISVMFYHVISFVMLNLLNFDSYSFLILLKVLGCNIIMTVIYTSLIYKIIEYIYKKYDLKLIKETNYF